MSDNSGSDCTFINSQRYDDPRAVFLIGAIISYMCYGYILYLRFVIKLPALSRHPTGVIISHISDDVAFIWLISFSLSELSIYKVLFEVLFVSQFFWLAFVPQSQFWESDDSNGTSLHVSYRSLVIIILTMYLVVNFMLDCVTPPQFAILCFVCQFSLLGAELWFFVLSRDMFLTVSNPFSSYKRMANRFTVFVFGIAALSGCILMAVGSKVYGLSSDPMIWIQVGCLIPLLM